MKYFNTALALFLFSFSAFAQKDTITTETNSPLSIEVKYGILYIAEANDNKITTINLSSTNQTPALFLAGLLEPSHLEFYGDYLYMAENSGGLLSRFDINEFGPAGYEAILAGLGGIKSLHIIGTEMYIGLASTILKKDLTSNSPATVVLDGLEGPIYFVEDGIDLYYSEYGNGTISKIDITETVPNPVPVLTGLAGPQGGMLILQNELYFFQHDDAIFGKINLTEPTPTFTEIDSGLTGSDILLIGTDIYVSDSQSGMIFRYTDQVTVSTDEHNTNQLRMFPNPTSNVISFDNETAEQYGLKEYSITNATGALISAHTYTGNNQIDLSDLPAGIYFILFEGENWKNIEKVTRL